ncbi:unnamed protein product [Camellia sinensis]
MVFSFRSARSSEFRTGGGLLKAALNPPWTRVIGGPNCDPILDKGLSIRFELEWKLATMYGAAIITLISFYDLPCDNRRSTKRLAVDSLIILKFVNGEMDTLKRHLPFTGEEGLLELRKIAVRFEEKIYTAATSQSDYLRKISLKMLTMENKHQNFVASSPPLNAASNITKPPHTGAAES